MEVTVQIVPGDMSGIITASGAALRLPLDRRLDAFFTADPQDPLIIHCDAMLFVQFIPDPPVTHVRMFFMDVFDLLRDLFVVLLTETDRVFQPTIISASGKVQVLAKSLYGIVLLLRQFFDRLIFVKMPSQR